MTTFLFVFFRSAKFLPSVGKPKIACGSFTSEVTFVDDQACLMTGTTPRGLKRVITNTLETCHLGVQGRWPQHQLLTEQN